MADRNSIVNTPNGLNRQAWESQWRAEDQEARSSIYSHEPAWMDAAIHRDRDEIRREIEVETANLFRHDYRD